MFAECKKTGIYHLQTTSYNKFCLSQKSKNESVLPETTNGRRT